MMPRSTSGTSGRTRKLWRYSSVRGGGPKGDGFVDSVDASCQVAGAVLDATSFYAEMGGQTFDTGSLLIDDSSVLQVDDVQVYAGYIVHVGAPSTTLRVGDSVQCAVDYDRRQRVRPTTR